MATYAKTKLSASAGGQGIAVSATSTPGTLIHETGTNPAHIHEVWLYAVNYDTTDRKLTIEWGSTGTASATIEYTVKAENGLYLIVPGLVLYGEEQGNYSVRAFAATGTAITIHGYVNTIT